MHVMANDTSHHSPPSRKTIMQRFQGKTVLVTGGSTGIGLAAAQAYAAEGARVVITGRDEAALAAAREQIGHDALVVRSDASSIDAAAELASAIRGAGLTLDAVFINAGMARFSSLSEADPALWDRIFDTNVKGAYFQLQALLPLLNRGAAVVLNGSVNAHIGMPGSSIYAASKAALISLARTLSGELLAQGIRVNVVSPGPVATPLYDKLGLDPLTLQETAAQIQGQVPLGRFATPAEIAATVLHLSAAESAFIVGTEIVVDGGMSRL
jgi:NAD(P)-dependent dehydrogenase (short-subunit alcohol dehydrogenase family)